MLVPRPYGWSGQGENALASPAAEDTFLMWPIDAVICSAHEYRRNRRGASQALFQERDELRLRLLQLDREIWTDSADPLTDSEKALLDTRLAAYRKESRGRELLGRCGGTPARKTRCMTYRVIVRLEAFRAFRSW